MPALRIESVWQGLCPSVWQTAKSIRRKTVQNRPARPQRRRILGKTGGSGLDDR
ncbi:hypothetical protein SL1157_1722 [Ruegeria lacuscaerulensis ITI-1157]|nr:hypothetical protein SL1157_1722 [Ruegeria lacuscaerulensis ITI-1157]